MKTNFTAAIALFFFLLAFAFTCAAETVVHFEGGTIKMPSDPGAPVEEEVTLPWGKAVQKSYHAFDPAIGTSFIFATFTFKNPNQALKKAKLRNIPEYFLRNHGCTAVPDANQHYQDASGRIWPQVVFGGVFKAPERYQVAVLLSGNRLFWLHAYRDMFNNPKAKTMSLDEALKRFVSGLTLEVP